MILFDHPKEVCMTYYEHFIFSISISYKLLKGSMKAAIHAVLPNLYETSSSDLLNDLQKILMDSGCKDD